jgi:hypothetical protein
MIVPPDQISHHHYAGINPIQPFSYARQQPTPPKKHIQHDTDVYVNLKKKKKSIVQFFFFLNRITQSRSFQILEGWIADSEKTIAAVTSPPPSSPSLTNSSAGEDLTFVKYFIIIRSNSYRIVKCFKGQSNENIK